MKRDVKDTHIYFPRKVLAEMKKIAAANRRSVSAEMVIAAENHVLDHRGTRSPNGAKESK